MLTIFMIFDEEFKHMLANDLCIFFQDKIEEIEELFQIGKVVGDQVSYYQNITLTHERLMTKYMLNEKEITQNKDPKLVTKNGTVTQIINKDKLLKSMKYWIGLMQY